MYRRAKRANGHVQLRILNHFVRDILDTGYRAMASDTAREAEAQEWCNGFVKDFSCR